ncbi:Protein arginine N-methyltransferase 5 [Perkinsus olseni]|uniref:Protein arginine N-methyltransferase 5 n=1 Tax=Perkinsus olseni TaxID=32597 RepID=A0A7J6PZV7_PEROL|nr:Protein arginine N-methyltransferase 5 [Perkinsus olseni]
MPIAHPHGGVSPLYLGRCFDGDRLPQAAVTDAGGMGFDYIAVPLNVHDADAVDSMLSIEAKVCQSSLVGRITSVSQLQPQLSWARYLSTYGVCLPSLAQMETEADLANYAAMLKREVVTTATPSQQWQKVPSGMWAQWNALRSLLNHPLSLTIALSLSQDLGPCPDRWLGEPVRVVIISSDLLTGAGTIGTPAHQRLLVALMQRKAQVLLQPAADDLAGPLKAAVSALYHKMPSPSGYEKYCEPYYDILQQPLQPLKDDLDNTTYATFEDDFTKYMLYEHAVAEFLADRGPLERDAKLSIAVVGAGRGGLVEAALRAMSKSSSLQPGDVIFYAVEKNEDAVMTLRARARHRDEWKAHSVEVVYSDLRDWTPSMGPLDVVISEFLGSFGDNEASPELLTDAFLKRILKPNGVCIPRGYTSFCQPMMCPALWTDIRSLMADTTTALGAGGLANSDKRLSTPFVVITNRCFYPSPSVGAQEVFTFDHQRPDEDHSDDHSDSGDRFKSLSFPVEADAVIHGLQGYFECSLYGSVTMSINPKTHTPDMVSWFPIFLPLASPITVKRGQVFTWNIWRRVDHTTRRMWYEWCVTSPCVKPVQNTNEHMANHVAAVPPDSQSGVTQTSPTVLGNRSESMSSDAAPLASVTAAASGGGRRRPFSTNSFKGPRGVCWAFQSSGRCHRGDGCPFQHHFRPTPDGNANNSQVLQPPRLGNGSIYNYNGVHEHSSPTGMGSKTILCRSLSEGRVCHVAGCRFGHSISEVMEAVEFCKQRECVFFNRGFCRKGESCPYVHSTARQRPRGDSSQWAPEQQRVKRDDATNGSSLLKTPPIGPQNHRQGHNKQTSKGYWAAKAGGSSSGPFSQSQRGVAEGTVQQQHGSSKNVRETVLTISAEATGATDTTEWPVGVSCNGSDGKQSGSNSPVVMPFDIADSVSSTPLAYIGSSQPSTAASSVCCGFTGATQDYADYCRALQLRESFYPNVSVEKLRRASTDAVYED